MAVRIYSIYYVTSFVALTFDIKNLEISVAYAVWSGVGIALIGILYFKGAATMLNFAGKFRIVAGEAGLKIASLN
jgi:small multidrug resistance pump